MKKNFFCAGFFLFLLIATYSLRAQDTTYNTFGKGIRTIAFDSTFSIKFSTRIQTRYDAFYTEKSQEFSDNFYLRRARLKFDGFAFSPKLIYKIEYELVTNEMLDAVLKWNLSGNLFLWFGQTKLPGNVERVISSQNLQFVDRSLLNARFNIDRDRGIQLRHHIQLGKVLIREKLAVSEGEGKNFRGDNNQGHDYTGRLEILPFGAFEKKGEYIGSDLYRENSPRLMAGVTFDFNDDAIRSQGQRGEVLSESRDLKTIFADFVFKYRGFSFLGEYAERTAYDHSPVIPTGENEEADIYYTGSAINTQAGYLFHNNLELALRYTSITPEKITGFPDVTQYTMGVSKYIVGHSLKVQSDITWEMEENNEDEYIYRLQVELAS